MHHFGLSAGYYGLTFQLSPNYSLDDSADVRAKAYELLELGIDYYSCCTIGA
jgi:hypothetical protein